MQDPIPSVFASSRVLGGARGDPFAGALPLAGCPSDTFILDKAFVVTTSGQPDGEITQVEYPLTSTS